MKLLTLKLFWFFMVENTYRTKGEHISDSVINGLEQVWLESDTEQTLLKMHIYAFRRIQLPVQVLS